MGADDRRKWKVPCKLLSGWGAVGPDFPSEQNKSPLLGKNKVAISGPSGKTGSDQTQEDPLGPDQTDQIRPRRIHWDQTRPRRIHWIQTRPRRIHWVQTKLTRLDPGGSTWSRPEPGGSLGSNQPDQTRPDPGGSTRTRPDQFLSFSPALPVSCPIFADTPGSSRLQEVI